MKRAAWVLGLVVAAAGSTAALGDRLHLDNGRTIEASRWWIDGNTLYVETAGGTMGIPRSLVVRVEETASAPSARSARPVAPEKASGQKDVPSLEARAREEARGHLLEGFRALKAREFDAASLAFGEAMRADPTSIDARAGYAVAEMRLGRDAMALAPILDGLVEHPHDAQLLEILGDLRDREENVPDALAAWEQAFASTPGDRLREKIEKARRELSAGRDYAFSAAAHFNLRYDGELDDAWTGAILDFLESQFREQTSRFRHAPAQPITVLLYPKREFQDVTRAGDEIAGLYDGKIRIPLGGLPVAGSASRLGPALQAVLAHELTHAIVHSKTRGNCPRWLQEGLAQISENRPFPRAHRLAVARALAAGPVETWADRAFSYPGALSLTRYLESLRGFDGVVAALDRLGDGASLDDALRAMYGDGYATLCSRWAATLREERE